jgi:uncharacterized NAD-dependent epimerase/dehydratase family protein
VDLRQPYLIFIDDKTHPCAGEIGQTLVRWQPEVCLGQIRPPRSTHSLGLPDLSLEEAFALGAGTLVIGTASRSGGLCPSWAELLLKALSVGFDIAAGLKGQSLQDSPALAAAAARHGRRLIDARHQERPFPVATGIRRSGRRLLTISGSGASGLLDAAMSLKQEMDRRGLSVSFRATSPAGILLNGSGIDLDSLPAANLSGAVEEVSPASAESHWDVIEGRGSLYHPASAAVSLGLLLGAQPDALVLCHAPNRLHLAEAPHLAAPSPEAAIATALAMARLTNPAVRCLGVCLDTGTLPDADIPRLMAETEDRLGLPAANLQTGGVTNLIDRLGMQ